MPIVLSPVPRNEWREGKVRRASKNYGKWAGEVAQAAGALFIDLNELVARRYEELGEAKVEAIFPGDHPHTSEAGAKFNAEAVVEGIRGLKGRTGRQEIADPLQPHVDLFDFESTACQPDGSSYSVR